MVVAVPSETLTSKTYVLSAPMSPGTSKFGATLNETAPVAASICNNPSSLAEEEFTKAKVKVEFASSSLAARVATVVWFSSISAIVSVSKEGASLISKSLT